MEVKDNLDYFTSNQDAKEDNIDNENDNNSESETEQNLFDKMINEMVKQNRINYHFNRDLVPYYGKEYKYWKNSKNSKNLRKKNQNQNQNENQFQFQNLGFNFNLNFNLKNIKIQDSIYPKNSKFPKNPKNPEIQEIQENTENLEYNKERKQYIKYKSMRKFEMNKQNYYNTEKIQNNRTKGGIMYKNDENKQRISSSIPRIDISHRTNRTNRINKINKIKNSNLALQNIINKHMKVNKNKNRDEEIAHNELIKKACEIVNLEITQAKEYQSDKDKFERKQSCPMIYPQQISKDFFSLSKRIENKSNIKVDGPCQKANKQEFLNRNRNRNRKSFDFVFSNQFVGKQNRYSSLINSTLYRLIKSQEHDDLVNQVKSSRKNIEATTAIDSNSKNDKNDKNDKTEQNMNLRNANNYMNNKNNKNYKNYETNKNLFINHYPKEEKEIAREYIIKLENKKSRNDIDTKEKFTGSLSDKPFKIHINFKTKHLDPEIIPEIIKPFRKMDLDKILLDMKQK